MRSFTNLFIVSLVLAVSLLALTGSPQTAYAAGANVTTEVGECGETTITVTNSTTVDNIFLYVEANGILQKLHIPKDGVARSITAGPFFDNTIVYWRIFGGGERDYDNPLWNHHGESDFGTQINNYGAANGWAWLSAGTSDPNPFVTWNEIPVEGCPLTKDQCKDDGWIALGFRNQGDCIQFVNTGK